MLQGSRTSTVLPLFNTMERIYIVFLEQRMNIYACACVHVCVYEATIWRILQVELKWVVPTVCWEGFFGQELLGQCLVFG